jgi:AraC-like DNA-binding protein
MASTATDVSYPMLMTAIPIVTGPASARVRVALPDPVGDDDLRIAGYGVREWMPAALLERPHGNEFGLLMAFNHPVEIGVEERPVAVDGNSFIAWQPWAPHHYGNTDIVWNHSWLMVEGAALSGWLADAGIAVDTPLAGVPPRLLERCVLGIHEELSHGPATDPHILRNHLHTCLRQVARAAQGEGGGPPQVQAVRSLLETRYAEHLTLPLLARHVGWSVPHLCERFRRHFGASPVDYLIRLRLAQAHFLLRDRGLGVAEAARSVGYDDYHHFTKLFRRRYGFPPSAVRQGPGTRPRPRVKGR